MKGNTIDRLVAAGVFVYALVLYLLTVAPTASFWDAGEFIAIADGLQVSHPPGAPFYMLVGRLFSMVFAPILGLFVERGEVALAVNLVSVLASALTVLLTHLVIVRLVRIWQGTPETWSPVDRLAALGGGVVGALTFAVTDSFWFNAVEAEVYAMSMFFTAIVVWLILRWREEKLEEEAALRARDEHPFGLQVGPLPRPHRLPLRPRHRRPPAQRADAVLHRPRRLLRRLRAARRGRRRSGGSGSWGRASRRR